MAQVTTSTTTTVTELSPQRTLIRPLIVGAGVGLLGYLLTLAIKFLFIENVFCRSADTQSICADGWNISWIAAHILVGLGSIFALVRAGVFRPLLVVIAAFVALWGVGAWIVPLAWPLALFWEVVLFGVAYALFAWLASITRFIFSFILIVAAVILARLVMAL